MRNSVFYDLFLVQPFVSQQCKIILQLFLLRMRRDFLGNTPVTFAAICDHIGILGTLVQNGGNVYSLDSRKYSALHWASYIGEYILLVAVTIGNEWLRKFPCLVWLKKLFSCMNYPLYLIFFTRQRKLRRADSRGKLISLCLCVFQDNWSCLLYYINSSCLKLHQFVIVISWILSKSFVLWQFLTLN